MSEDRVELKSYLLAVDVESVTLGENTEFEFFETGSLISEDGVELELPAPVDSAEVEPIDDVCETR